MDLSSNRECPRCGQMSYFMNATAVGLPVYQKTHAGNFIVDQSTHFPVRPHFCKVCNFVEFFVEKPVLEYTYVPDDEE
jgi:predicted nucleic-acid-binding Zn-ribbon protein